MNRETAAARAFDVGGAVDAVEVHPTGHINDAYLVTANGQPFRLQRLNPVVFPDPDAVMANVVTVTDHLRAKHEPTLTLVPTRNGAPSWRDDTGAVWRMYRYIDGVHQADVRSPEDAAVVGRAFGRFHRSVADLEPGRLRVSLPGFHDLERRIASFDSTVAADPCGRALAAAPLIATVDELRRLAKDAASFASLPPRTVHNDAKAANLLVDDNDAREPLVIDLDTVMPGTILWDVGDMVRSATGTPDEASATVGFDYERYRALLDAWLTETDDLLTPAERDSIPQAGPVITYEQAVRFLTDHLQGDVYFRISQPDENRERARNQLNLLQSMLWAIAE